MATVAWDDDERSPIGTTTTLPKDFEIQPTTEPDTRAMCKQALCEIDARKYADFHRDATRELASRTNSYRLPDELFERLHAKSLMRFASATHQHVNSTNSSSHREIDVQEDVYDEDAAAIKTCGDDYHADYNAELTVNPKENAWATR